MSNCLTPNQRRFILSLSFGRTANPPLLRTICETNQQLHNHSLDLVLFPGAVSRLGRRNVSQHGAREQGEIFVFQPNIKGRPVRLTQSGSMFGQKRLEALTL